MQNYLGEFDVELSSTPFATFTPNDWAMHFIGSYGQIDGGHHKTWVLDQAARILKGTPIIVKQARWDNGSPEGHSEYRCSTGDPSEEYLEWVKEMLGEWDQENGEYEYDYDEGIAP